MEKCVAVVVVVDRVLACMVRSHDVSLVDEMVRILILITRECSYFGTNVMSRKRRATLSLFI